MIFCYLLYLMLVGGNAVCSLGTCILRFVLCVFLIVLFNHFVEFCIPLIIEWSDYEFDLM